MISEDKAFILEQTTHVVAARVNESDMDADEIEALYRRVFAMMHEICQSVEIICDVQEPAVPIEDSIQPDYLVCLEDGKKMKMMRRYLRTSYDMTPEEYREKWDLPDDYPMTAPNYAKKRSNLAKDIGLGKSKTKKKGKPTKKEKD